MFRRGAGMTPRRIAFLGFDGITALDLIGPAEAFASAFLDDPGIGRDLALHVVERYFGREVAANTPTRWNTRAKAG